MSDDAGARRAALTRTALFAGIGTLIGVDLLYDWQEGASWLHLGAELLVLSLSAVGATLGWRRFREARSALRRLDADLAAVRERAERWRAENQALVRGLGSAIEGQFGNWGLTTAEAEVGLLLLKGMSLKEIAMLRETSERTVREQARAIYRKAGLGGRAELSAFFLEDLLPAPEADRGGAPGAAPDPPGQPAS
jgi:DNA-binding CsgD family transcriptional regulator